MLTTPVLATTELRRDLIQRHSAPYAAHPLCRVVMVVGSVARDVTDGISDIDTLVLYEEPLPRETLDALLAEAIASGGGLHYRTDTELVLYHFAEGVKIDYVHCSVARVEEDLQKMLDAPTTDLIIQLIITGHLESYAIKGTEWVETWKEKLRPYPPTLAAMMVRQHLKFLPYQAYEVMGIARGESLWVKELYVEAVQNIVGMLFGVNRAYHPGKLKGIQWWLNRLPLTPPRLHERLEQLLHLPPLEGLEILKSLLEDTLSLVDAHVPEVDTGPVRKRLGMRLG